MPKITLHPYQEQAKEFVKSRPAAGLFLGMGCGKTAITLQTLYEMNPSCNVLVIAPKTIARSTWLDEIEKWGFPFKTKSFIVNDKGRQYLKKDRLKAYAEAVEATKNNDFYIYFINNELVADLVENIKPWIFPFVVIDECQSFKTPSSKRFKALKKVRPFISKLVELTGTPSPNGLMDLWAQIYLIDKGQRLGSSITQYRNAFFKPTAYINGYTPIGWQALPGAKEEIYKRIKDCVISVENTSLNLPPLTMNNVNVTMEPDEQKLYDEMKKELVLTLDGQDIIAANAAVLSAKLSQMASGALYLDDSHNYKVIHQSKLEMLEDMLSNIDTPTLVAYHFKSDKEMILNYLTKHKHKVYAFNGEPDMVHAWNRKEIPVMLLQPQSAGHGLNLQDGGSTLIWYTVPWSLEGYLQTNARVYRQGQTEPTVIHHLLTKNTIDARILSALQRKDLSEQELLNAVKLELTT